MWQKFRKDECKCLHLLSIYVFEEEFLKLFNSLNTIWKSWKVTEILVDFMDNCVLEMLMFSDQPGGLVSNPVQVIESQVAQYKY